MGFPMLDPIQNNVIFITFFSFSCKESRKTASNRLNGTGCTLFSLKVESKKKLKEISLLAAYYKMRQFIPSNVDFHRHFSDK